MKAYMTVLLDWATSNEGYETQNVNRILLYRRCNSRIWDFHVGISKCAHLAKISYVFLAPQNDSLITIGNKFCFQLYWRSTINCTLDRTYTLRIRYMSDVAIFDWMKCDPIIGEHCEHEQSAIVSDIHLIYLVRSLWFFLHYSNTKLRCILAWASSFTEGSKSKWVYHIIELSKINDTLVVELCSNFSAVCGVNRCIYLAIALRSRFRVLFLD